MATNPISQINGKYIYALTASYALTGGSGGGGSIDTGSLLTTASITNATITFTKGDGSTFPITVAYPIDISGNTLYSKIGSISSGFSTVNSILLGNSSGNGAINAGYSNFIGYLTGQSATNAGYSNFIGYDTGDSAYSASYSNFLGFFTGYSANNANNSNFIGAYAGYNAYNASTSNFIGYSAGYGATGATNSNFIGQNAGNVATGATDSNFLGQYAGYQATSANSSNFLGLNAGQSATNAAYSNFLGNAAGIAASYAIYSNFLGINAGYNAYNASGSNFLGYNAGNAAYFAGYSNFLGYSTGYQATSAAYSNFLGYGAGYQATTSSYSNFIGYQPGYQARFASGSNFIGWRTGIYAVSASYSTFIGFQAGAGTGSITLKSNNIVIGTNITLPANTQDSINIGAIIFATGSYFNTSSITPAYSGSQVGIGRVGINKVNPTYTLDVSGSGNYSNGLTVTGSVIVSGSDITTAWTSYTPAWTTDGGTQPVLNNGTITGAYKQIGKTVFVRVKLNAGTTTTFGTGAFQFSLPVSASSPDGIQFPCSMLDNGIHWYQGIVNGTYTGATNKSAIIYPNTSGWSDAVTSTSPFTWGSADSLQFNGSYESV
jgi:hypothetical protein